MQKLFLYASLLLISGLLGACRKVIEAKDLPQQDPRIVLNCLIFNNDSVRANITASKSILSGKDYKYLDNAICELYENDTYVEQLVNRKNGNFVGKKLAQSGKKYTLKVACAGYKSVEGSTTLGDSVVVKGIERTDSANYYFRKENLSTYQYIGGSVRYKVMIKDDIKIRNYYSIQPIVVLMDSLGAPVDFSITPYISLLNGDSNSGVSYYGTSIETDDQTLVNGNEVRLDLDINFNISSSPLPPATSVQVYLVMGNISEDLYKYKVTTNKQAIESGGLFSEPVLVYNNVTNGMGIVGGVNSNVYFLHSGPLKK